MKTLYSKEMRDFIHAHVEGRTNAELARKLNEHFGTSFSKEQMKDYKRHHHLSSNTRRRVANYPQKVEKYIAENYAGCSPMEMARRINAIFKLDYSADQIRTYYRKQGYRSGCKAPVFEGEIREYILENYERTGPKRMAELVNAKFGTAISCKQMSSLYYNHGLVSHAPHGGQEILPIGHERRYADGAVMIKVSGFGDNTIYARKHRLIWEQANGPMPPNSYLIFLDGDKTNCSLENLRLVTKQEFFTLIHQNLLTENPDANESAILIARIRATIKNRTKRSKK